MICRWYCHAINSESQVVINCLRCGKLKGELQRLFLVACVAKSIDTNECHFVSAVPQQSFLSMFQIQVHINRTAFQRQGVVTSSLIFFTIFLPFSRLSSVLGMIRLKTAVGGNWFCGAPQVEATLS